MARHYYSSTAVDTTLVGGISNSATSIVVSSTTGFPGSFPYYLTLRRDSSSREVIEVTNAVGTTLTVTRGQSGTSAVAHSAGASVTHDAPSAEFNESSQHANATGAVHGLAGSIVGTSDSQTLTNKTMSGASNTFSAIPNAAVTAANGGTSLGNDVVNLDTRVDALETATANSGWVTTGFTAGTDFTVSACRYRKIGIVAYVEVALTRANTTLAIAASGNIVGDPVMVTIPAASRPNVDQYQIWENSGVANGAARIETDGEIRLLDGTPSHTIAIGSTIYLTGSWITT